jgi:hypothetical protein
MDFYWSSSPVADGGYEAWGVYFYDGCVWAFYDSGTSADGDARCVR